MPESNLARMLQSLRADIASGYGMVKTRGFQLLQRFLLTGFLLILCAAVAILNRLMKDMFFSWVLRPILFVIFLQLTLIAVVVLYEAIVLFFGLNWQTIPILLRTVTTELVKIFEERTTVVKDKVLERSGISRQTNTQPSPAAKTLAADDVPVDVDGDIDADVEESAASDDGSEFIADPVTVRLEESPPADSPPTSDTEPDITPRRASDRAAARAKRPVPLIRASSDEPRVAELLMSPSRPAVEGLDTGLVAASAVIFMLFKEASSEHIFYISADLCLMELRRTATYSWRPYNVSVLLGIPPLDATASPTGQISLTQTPELWIAVVDENGAPRLLTTTTAMRWRETELPALKRPVKAGFSVTMTQVTSMQQQLTVVTNDEHICSLRHTGGKWAVSSVSEAVGKDKAVQGLKPMFPPAVHTGLGQLHVCFVGHNGTLHEFQHLSFIGWSYKLLSSEATLARRPIGKAASPLSGFSVYQAGALLFYRTSKGEIMLLSNASTITGWRADNLTSMARAPKCAGWPSVVGSGDMEACYIAFVTAEGSVGLIYRKDEKVWFFEDVSQISGMLYTDRAGRRRRVGKVKPGQDVSAHLVGSTIYISFRRAEGNVCMLRGNLTTHEWVAVELTSLLRQSRPANRAQTSSTELTDDEPDDDGLVESGLPELVDALEIDDGDDIEEEVVANEGGVEG